MLITTVIGTPQQLVKAVMVSKAFEKAGIKERLIHSGQRSGEEMPFTFFRELGLREPEKNLELESGSHASQTAKALQALEIDFNACRPDAVLVYGDTNTTLAGALAGSKLNIPVIHFEAGLRSFNRTMQEEINRLAVDRVSTLLFAPTREAVKNLKREGIKRNHIAMTGDVMCEALLHFGKIAEERSRILDTLALKPRSYNLLAVHPPSDLDDAQKLRAYLQGISESGGTTVFPVHPRTTSMLEAAGKSSFPNVRMISPCGYLDMIKLGKRAKLIVTDTGEVQKEAYIHKVPCITLRPGTEWTETTRNGWNRILGEDAGRLKELLAAPCRQASWRSHYGDGDAAAQAAAAIQTFFREGK